MKRKLTPALVVLLLFCIFAPLLAGEGKAAPAALSGTDASEAAAGDAGGDAAVETTGEWLHRTVLSLKYWQWLGLLILVGACVVIDRVIWFIAGRIIRRQISRPEAELTKKEASRAGRPFGLAAAAGLWLILLAFLALPQSVYNILFLAGIIIISISGIWTLFRIIDIGSDYALRLTKKTESKLDDLLVPLARKMLKIFVVVFGVLFIADNLHMDMKSLLAGAGLGGLAFALAAKDMVANLFGSLTVLADRPFQIGDWVVIGDAEGTVEEVGLRTTRVRTFYNSLLTIPNSKITNTTVDNMGVRKYRRISTKIGLLYSTPPEKVDAFCEGVRELIRLHPYTRKDYFHVYLNEFGPSGLNVLLYCFHEAPDWSTELRERHRLYLDILRVAEKLGVEIAFPTQTIHLAKEGEKPTGAAKPPAEGDALELGRRCAGDVVAETLGRDAPKPPPVTFN